MSAHTSGPWRVLKAIRSGAVEGVQLGDGTVVDGMSEADARLIAAAPDLLAALEAMVEPLCAVSCTAREHAPRCTAARAAIAKARGTP